MPPRVTRTGIATSRGVGGPDYAAPKPVGQTPIGPIFTLTDLAEVAARLGSINTFDRRGYTVWMDDFESNNIDRWWVGALGVGASATISNEAARSGSLSCKMVSGSDLVATGISRYLSIPVISRVGIEASFAALNWGSTFEMQISYHDGVTLYRAAVRYIDGAVGVGSLEVEDNVAGWVTLATGLNFGTHVSAFQTMKFVFDLESKNYVRVLLNSFYFDLSAYTSVLAGLSPLRRLSTVIYIHPADLVNRVVYVDDFIATQSEPDNLP